MNDTPPCSQTTLNPIIAVAESDLSVESPEELFTCIKCGLFWPAIIEGEAVCNEPICLYDDEIDMCIDYDAFVKRGDLVEKMNRQRRS